MPKLPHRKKKTEFVGLGCVIQGLSLVGIYAGFMIGGVLGAFTSADVAIAAGVIGGLVIMVPLFIWGSMLSKKWVCSECRNPLFDKKVKICPVCKSKFE